MPRENAANTTGRRDRLVARAAAGHVASLMRADARRRRWAEARSGVQASTGGAAGAAGSPCAAAA